MNPKKYIREEPDGRHWPDGEVGDQLIYGVDFTDYVTESFEIITNIAWTLPIGGGITSSDEFEQGYIALIKLTLVTAGTYKVICTMTSTLSGKELIQAVPMMLTVY